MLVTYHTKGSMLVKESKDSCVTSTSTLASNYVHVYAKLTMAKALLAPLQDKEELEVKFFEVNVANVEIWRNIAWRG